MRFSCVGRGGRWAGLSSVFVRTPLRVLSERRKRRCNAPALRFPTSVLRFHLRRFAPPSDGHLAAGARGLGGWGGHAGLPKKSRKSSHQTRGIEKSGKSYLDRRLRFRHTELKTPLVERIPVVHLWASPGAWGGHAGLPKITEIISSDTGNRKKWQVFNRIKSALARSHPVRASAPPPPSTRPPRPAEPRWRRAGAERSVTGRGATLAQGYANIFC
eukprot:gene17012-biopygen6809